MAGYQHSGATSSNLTIYNIDNIFNIFNMFNISNKFNIFTYSIFSIYLKNLIYSIQFNIQ